MMCPVRIVSAGRDPLFTKVADAWMKQVIADFGTDHAWQMDGFFGNGTGWGAGEPADAATEHAEPPHLDSEVETRAEDRSLHIWDYGQDSSVSYTKWAGVDSKITGAKGGSCGDGTCQALGCGLSAACGALGCHGKGTMPCDIVALEQACTANPRCTAFNSNGWLKSCGASSCGAVQHSSEGCDLYVSSRPAPPAPPPPPTPPPPVPLPPDPVFYARAKAAYGAISRADGPTARWIFQGWALHVAGSGMSPPGPQTLARVHGFSAAANPGNFILMDMAASGQWKDWHGQWGFPFIWTSLPDFGGNQ